MSVVIISTCVLCLFFYGLTSHSSRFELSLCKHKIIQKFYYLEQLILGFFQAVVATVLLILSVLGYPVYSWLINGHCMFNHFV